MEEIEKPLREPLEFVHDYSYVPEQEVLDALLEHWIWEMLLMLQDEATSSHEEVIIMLIMRLSM
jgi:hypothetical protein